MKSSLKKLSLVVLSAVSLGSAQPAKIDPSSLPLPEDPAAYSRIRVAVMQNKETVKLASKSPYRLETLETRALIDHGSKLPETDVKSQPRGIRFGSRNLEVPGVNIVSKKPVSVNDKKLHDSIRILRDKKGKLLVVNELDLEEYLRGVVPHEMWVTWPKEALKAQAVVSRTFAIFKALTKSGEPYMLQGDVIGQVFGGRGAEKPASDEAVRKTRAEILTYEGNVFPAYFHSTCAGHTTRPEFNWDIEAHPVLKGVPCPYCKDSKYYRWKGALSAKALAEQLRKEGYPVSDLRQIVPRNWDASDRAGQIVVWDSKRDVVLRANDFRLIAGPGNLKSTKGLRVWYNGDIIQFSGYGWGHGVGMCQWGAKKMAEEGKSYKEILAYYYPGSKITKVKS